MYCAILKSNQPLLGWKKADRVITWGFPSGNAMVAVLKGIVGTTSSDYTPEN